MVAYPKSVAFIISNEFCERFCFYGMRAILVLYLIRKLGYDDDNATVTFHVFTSLAYFFPILGAIIADSWLGRFRTILYLSVVYMVGSVIISIGAIPQLNLPANTVTLVGLLLIAIGTGGIKPCVSAFGGDQFRIPEQAKQLAVFFSLFYMAINAGSLLSTMITPILREDVPCFGEDTCFSLAFGVPGALMAVSILVFIIGRPFYTITKPSGNMLVMVFKCCYNAIRTRRLERPLESTPRAHWLDYAQTRYGPQLVNDVKVLLRILLLYMPLPIFWALFDQQGSRWTFQASRMNGELAGGFTIKPDQMQVVNPVLILCFIPLWDACVYPALSRCGIRRPLQRLTMGMVLVAAAFVMSAGLEMRLESLDPVVPAAGEAQLRVINGGRLAEPIVIRTGHSDVGVFNVSSMSMVEMKHVRLQHAEAVDFRVVERNLSGVFNLQPGAAVTYFVTRRDNRTHIVDYVDDPRKPSQDQPLLRILLDAEDYPDVADMQNGINQTTASEPRQRIVRLRSHRTDLEKTLVGFDAMRELHAMAPGRYSVYIVGDNQSTLVDDRLEIDIGGVYTYVMSEIGYNTHKFQTTLLTIVEPNSVHVLWQLPQYVVVTAAEIMFSVTGLEFSFTEAPDSMKSVLQACWLLTVTVGNIIVVIVARLKFFDRQSSEFLLFAGLMLLDAVLFVWLAMGYRYNSLPEAEVAKMTETKAKKKNTVMAPVMAGVDNSGYVNDR